MAARSTVLKSPTGKRRTMFIPVAHPGSGKTRLADQLDKNNFLVISQDENKCTFADLKKIVEKYASGFTTRHLYIDSCNHSAKRRRELSAIATKYGMQVVFLLFDVPLSQRKQNIKGRLARAEYHPSIRDELTADEAVRTFLFAFEDVCEEEQADLRQNPGVSFIKVDGPERVDSLAKMFNEKA